MDDQGIWVWKYDPSTNQWKRLGNTIPDLSDIGGWMNDEKINLLTLTLGEILEVGSIITLFEGISTDCSKGVFNLEDLPTFDSYSNTEDFESMKEDQFNKLKNNGGKSDKLFLLSWTLTQDTIDAISGSPTIEELANKANVNLNQVLDNQRNGAPLFNILYTDYCNGDSTRICLLANNLRF